MFKPTKAKTSKEYLSQIPEDRRDEILFLHSYIKKVVPTLKSYFANNMLGYGSFQYINYKKEKINWPIIALSNQKNYISIYVCATADGKYIAEKYKKELGKVKVGRSCISFKKLADVNLPILKKVLKEARKHPGLVLKY